MGDQAPTCDFLIIGGGVIGLSIARELQKKKT
jgi:L-2-hydroxyglutarate oxidase LhgO